MYPMVELTNQGKSELPAKPKATFRWPPDCLWPFIDHGWDSKAYSIRASDTMVRVSYAADFRMAFM